MTRLDHFYLDAAVRQMARQTLAWQCDCWEKAMRDPDHPDYDPTLDYRHEKERGKPDHDKHSLRRARKEKARQKANRRKDWYE